MIACPVSWYLPQWRHSYHCPPSSFTRRTQLWMPNQHRSRLPRGEGRRLTFVPALHNVDYRALAWTPVRESATSMRMRWKTLRARLGRIWRALAFASKPTPGRGSGRPGAEPEDALVPTGPPKKPPLAGAAA